MCVCVGGGGGGAGRGRTKALHARPLPVEVRGVQEAAVRAPLDAVERDQPHLRRMGKCTTASAAMGECITASAATEEGRTVWGGALGKCNGRNKQSSKQKRHA